MTYKVADFQLCFNWERPQLTNGAAEWEEFSPVRHFRLEVYLKNVSRIVDTLN